MTSDRPVLFIKCKDMCGTVALNIFCHQVSKMCHKPSGCQIVKSQKISIFIMLFCWISSSNRNCLSRQNGAHTLILCKEFVLLMRAISLKVKYEKANFSNCVLAITLVIMNGYTFKLFENIINGVQNKGNGEINTA